MNEQGKTYSFRFKPVQYLGEPLIQAPQKKGFLSATIQFIIPGLYINEEGHEFLAISKHCGIDVYDAKLEIVENQDQSQKATLTSIAFYVPKSVENTNIDQEVENQARLLIERFMGILSFFAGKKFSVVNAQTSIIHDDGKVLTKLDPKYKTQTPKVEFNLPEKPFGGQIPSKNIFSALFWLRRGLANRDSLETYASLMVCLQCIARELIKLPADVKYCPKCRAEIEPVKPGITALVHELVVNKLGTPENQFEKIWKARNAIVAHGNKTITADVLLEITELKYTAITLCFDGIKLAMGLAKENPPFPHQVNFVTPAPMYFD
ncbi:MAG: hypothetical protein U9N44_02255 [Chloroflexota bacterium]|nr:hypothetical protein [Chloroflexota bacterium]